MAVQPTAPDPTKITAWVDNTTVPPTVKGWNGTAWVTIGGGAVSSVAGRTGAVTLTKTDIGLDQVNNTSDAAKPVSTAQAAAIAAAVNGLVNGAPGALDTLKELADAMADDVAFSATLTNALALKAPLASPTFTGTVSGITASMVGGITAGAVDSKIPTVTVQGLASGSTAAAANGTLIQNTIDALATAGGGELVIPVGQWYSTPIALKTRVALTGLGWGSILTLADGTNTHFVTLADGLQVQATIRDIRLDGNKANQTAGDVVRFDNTAYSDTATGLDLGDPNHAMRRVVVINGAGNGISTAGGLSQSQFDEVFSYTNNGNAFRIESPDNQFFNCIAAKSGIDNFYIASNSNRFVNCKSWLAGAIDATSGSGFRVANVSRIDLIGCEAQDNRQHGFSLNSTDTLNMSGCRVDRNGLGADGSGYQGDGIYAFTVTNSRIDVVSGDRNDGTLRQRWAYNATGTNSGNIVTIASKSLAGGVIGNGSWGTASFVTFSYAGTVSSSFATLASPTFTGTPTVPTAAAGTSTTQAASTAFVAAAQAALVGVNTKTSAYTTVLSDAGKLVLANSTSAITFTIPTNATAAYPVGTVIGLGTINTGALTIAGASGVTVNSPAGARITTQYGQASLVKIGTDTWLLSGQTVT